LDLKIFRGISLKGEKSEKRKNVTFLFPFISISHFNSIVIILDSSIQLEDQPIFFFLSFSFFLFGFLAVATADRWEKKKKNEKLKWKKKNEKEK